MRRTAHWPLTLVMMNKLIAYDFLIKAAQVFGVFTQCIMWHRHPKTALPRQGLLYLWSPQCSIRPSVSSSVKLNAVQPLKPGLEPRGDSLQNAGRWKVHMALFPENFKIRVSICAREGVEGSIHWSINSGSLWKVDFFKEYFFILSEFSCFPLFALNVFLFF